MRRLLLASAFCLGLLMFGAWVMIPTASAQKDETLAMLLRLPAPPPPNPLVPVPPGARPAEFFSESSPPPDNAPIQDLLDYWEKMSRAASGSLAHMPRLSDRVRSRLAAEIERDPSKLAGLINVFRDAPDSGRFVYDIYRRMDEDDTSLRSDRQNIREWLKYNSPYFADELARAASSVRDVREYVSNHNDLLALTRFGWDLASPIVHRLYNDSSQPVSRTVATWAMYRRAIDSNSLGDIERYRDELMRMVEDRTASAAVRDMAMDALVLEPDWPGRDDWYFTLLADETLAELRVDGQIYTGLTTLILRSPVERYRERMIELAASEDRTVRSASVRNLVVMMRRAPDEAIARALVPWLADPEWADDPEGNGRQTLIQALAGLTIPEAVPGLIALLNERMLVPGGSDDPDDVYFYGANTATNAIRPTRRDPAADSAMRAAQAAADAAAAAANAAANYTVRTSNSNLNPRGVTYVYPYRSNALSALGHQRDVRAAPAIRGIIGELNEWERASAIRGLLACGGYSAPEQLQALEHVVRTQYVEIARVAEKVQEILVSRGLSPETMPADVSPQLRREIMAEFEPFFEKVIAGRGAYSSDSLFALGTAVEQQSEPDDLVVRTIVRRIEDLDEKEKQVADIFRNILTRWKGSAVNSMLLSDLKRGRSDADGVVKLLADRKELREAHMSEVNAAMDGVPWSRGIAACILEDRMLIETLLANGGESAVSALACSRLLRIEIPVERVASLVNSTDRQLATAAERYLESEDSPEARQVLYRLHPNRAKILGATSFFSPGDETPVVTMNIGSLFSSVTGVPDDRQAFYALGVHEHFRETESKLREMVLGNDELLGIYAYDRNLIRIFSDRVEFRLVEDDARYRERILEPDEFDRLRGYLAQHRVDELPPFVSCGPGCDAKQLTMLGRAGGRRVFFQTDSDPDFLVGLESIFAEMAQAPMRLKYAAGEHIAGLELVFADDQKWAETVWADGGEVRALVTDRVARQNIEAEISRLYDTVFEDDDFTGEYDGDDISPLPDEPDDTGEFVAPEPELNPYQLAAEQRAKRKWEGISWWVVSGGRSLQPTVRPPGINVPPAPDIVEGGGSIDAWKAISGRTEIRVSEGGLSRIQQGKMTILKEGVFSDPVLSENGRWLVVRRLEEEVGFSLVRIDLTNGREFPVDAGEDATVVCFVPTLNRFLLMGAADYDYSYYRRTRGEDGELQRPPGDLDGRDYSLLDPVTGQIQEVKGEYRPLSQQTFRPLQQAGSPHEFWAAIPRQDGTEVGIYDSRHLGFRSLLKVPKISFTSMDMWVDGGLVYFVYRGHVLSLPISAK